MSNAPFNIVPYTIASFGTLLVYDYLCTFAQEVALIWSQPLHFGTLLFVINRYPPFIDTFLSLYLLTTVQSPETCTRLFKTVTWLIVLGVFIAEMILMFRTYAIYERKRWVAILLGVVLTMVVIPGIVVVNMELNSLSYGYPASGPYTGCTFTKPASAIIFVAYVLVVFSETIVVSLTLYKAVHHLRRSKAPLVVNLYRNGLMFYAYILVISLANVIVPVTAHDSTYDNWLATPQRVLHSIFCNRILLSILSSRRALVSHGSSTSDTTSNSRFGFALPLGHTRRQRRRNDRDDGDDDAGDYAGYRFTSVLPESSGSDSMLTASMSMSFSNSNFNSNSNSNSRSGGRGRSWSWSNSPSNTKTNSRSNTTSNGRRRHRQGPSGGLTVYTSFGEEDEDGEDGADGEDMCKGADGDGTAGLAVLDVEGDVIPLQDLSPAHLHSHSYPYPAEGDDSEKGAEGEEGAVAVERRVDFG